MSLRRWMVMMTAAMQGAGAGGVTIPDPVAYWKLDELSDGSAPVTRSDSVGANDLTDNNTTPSGAGKIGRCADFEASNSEYLEIADNADLSTGDVDFLIAAWVKLEGLTNSTIASKHGDNPNNEWWLRYFASGARFRLDVFHNGGNTSVGVNADNLGVVSTETWYYIVAWHDATEQTINISVNGGLADSADASSVTIIDTAAPFRIGAFATAVAIFMDGEVDEFGFWKGDIPKASEQISYLYNGGDGRTHPF